ncbi:MAG: SDR family NAD(P)-dependent oxidoreductase [Nitriliruptoraceae bacterium]|nr:SDR family NAD(P)-dependent oxidoreductase [Nitriliruptoraceae bacterium]
MPWTADDVPDLHGHTYVVTGASSGLGEATTIALATRGAHVVLATRSATKTAEVMDRIHHRTPAASMENLPLDLADLTSVAAAAATLLDRHGRIDAIVANAGIMAPPLTRTRDGFELQFGVNHLGHAAFVAGVLPAVLEAQGPVVVVSSGAHRIGGIDLADLNWERTTYRRWPAYGRSKLANLLYTAELQRRLEASGHTAIAVAAHPGYANTALQTTGPTMGGGLRSRATGVLSGLGNRVIAQPASRGVLPQLYATVAPDVPGGSYWGPDGPGQMRGFPTEVDRSSAARDPGLAAALWTATEELTGVSHGLAMP